MTASRFSRHVDWVFDPTRKETLGESANWHEIGDGSSARGLPTYSASPLARGERPRLLQSSAKTGDQQDHHQEYAESGKRAP
jgi:hypothetical protein